MYKLNYYKHIENRKIIFDEKKIKAYIEEVGSFSFKLDIDSTPFISLYHEENFKPLKECSVGDLKPAKWSLEK